MRRCVAADGSSVLLARKATRAVARIQTAATDSPIFSQVCFLCLCVCVFVCLCSCICVYEKRSWEYKVLLLVRIHRCVLLSSWCICGFVDSSFLHVFAGLPPVPTRQLPFTTTISFLSTNSRLFWYASISITYRVGPTPVRFPDWHECHFPSISGTGPQTQNH